MIIFNNGLASLPSTPVFQMVQSIIAPAFGLAPVSDYELSKVSTDFFNIPLASLIMLDMIINAPILLKNKGDIYRNVGGIKRDLNMSAVFYIVFLLLIGYNPVKFNAALDSILDNPLDSAQKERIKAVKKAAGLYQPHIFN